MLIIYNLLWIFGGLLAIPWLLVSVVVSMKRRKTVLQRLGIAASPGFRKISDTKHQPLWVHALSVGEVLSAVSLAKALKRHHPEYPIVFSASTLTGYETACRLLQDELDAIIYFPYDLIFSVRRAIDSIQPSLVVIVETDIWPNFLLETKRRAIPVILVNARLSDRSFAGYRRFSKWTSPLFQCFSAICAQSAEDACRFTGLGLPADKVTVTGNLKYDMPPDPSSESTIQSLRQIFPQTSGQKYLIAGSTHPGEETILLQAFFRLRKNIPDIHLILAPRNIERADEICRLAVSAGWSARLLTHIQTDTSPDFPDVVVVNTIGHLKSMYALSDVAFVGGSLLDFGGHNPLEPAAFAKPVLFGPHTGDVAESCRRMLADGGAWRIHDADDLTHAIHTLMTDPEKARSMGNQAHRILKENRGALDENLHIIQPFITA